MKVELSSGTRKYLGVPLRVHFCPLSRLSQGQPGRYLGRNISDNRQTAETPEPGPQEVVRITLGDAALRVTPEFFKEEDSVSLRAVPYTPCGRMMDSIPNSEPQVSPNEKINTTHSRNRKKLYDAVLLLCAGVRLLATRTITLRPISKFDQSPE